MNGNKMHYLPLRDALLCAECNFVSADEAGVCPVCRGRSLSRISDLLSQRRQKREWPSLQDLLDSLGIRRRSRQRDLGYATRQY